MLFGSRLANEVYAPWKGEYLNYDGLKKLLKENVYPLEWTPEDETRFVEALDTELEKTYSFQTKTFESLSARLGQIEDTISNANIDGKDGREPFDCTKLEPEIEDILIMSQQLDKFARMNFTGYTKIVKKHDRIHSEYSVNPLLQVRLNALPFHSEDYSPLITRLASLYAFLRANSVSPSAASASAKLQSLPNDQETEFTSYKFWVHAENLMEVKTRILRHLPVLVFNAANKNDGNESESYDPTITSLYFDNADFELYDTKLQKNDISPSLRIRWYGRLSDNQEVTLEKRVIEHHAEDEYVPDEKINLKLKNVQPFLDGKYSLEKNIQKMKDRNISNENEIDSFKSTVNSLQSFIKDHRLQPVVRAVYKRTAFQIPGDDSIRITIDNDISFIREDSFNETNPSRNPTDWHRTDIDDQTVKNPLALLKSDQYTKFPYAVLEIRIKNPRHVTELKDIAFASSYSNSVSKQQQLLQNFNSKKLKWIKDLTSSHLVKEATNFSKFIQGVASLFAEYDKLDSLPYWLPDLDKDIRIDPKQAWEKEREDKKKLKNSNGIKIKEAPKFDALEEEDSDREYNAREYRARPVEASTDNFADFDEESIADEEFEHELEQELDNESALLERSQNNHYGSTLQGGESSKTSGHKRVKSKFSIPFLYNKDNVSKLSFDSEEEEIVLPPGVVKPKILIRQQGPVKVETKVWLANERTFNKWLHITTLFSALTFTIYSSVNAAADTKLAELVAYILFGLSLFSGVWGYYTYMHRLKAIAARSEAHLDNILGPIIVAVALLGALIINFTARWIALRNEIAHDPSKNSFWL